MILETDAHVLTVIWFICQLARIKQSLKNEQYNSFSAIMVGTLEPYRASHLSKIFLPSGECSCINGQTLNKYGNIYIYISKLNVCDGLFKNTFSLLMITQ